MARFQANFSTYPAIVNAPAKVRFDNKSSVGKAIDDEFTEAIDRQGNVVDLFDIKISDVSVSAIEKFVWDFGDNSISTDEDTVHTFDYAGLYPVKLTIYSSEIYHQTLGIFYRIKNSVTYDVDIGSVTVAWLEQHMTTPHSIQMQESQGFRDLITASSKMFDRMYEDIGEAVKLIDIRNVAPRFLEVFSDTLGHKKFYSEKIGYAAQNNTAFVDSFLDYDIFDKISNNTVSDDEILQFRRFIMDTAKLFKMNGSEQAMEAFFKLYGFIVDIKEMWTTNFGTTPFPIISDNFFGLLEDTNNKFSYRDISVSGFDNNKGNIRFNVSNLILDNYHFSTKHIYPTDEISESGCESIFEINEIPPNILKVLRDDGRQITNIVSCTDLNTTTCTATDHECTENNISIYRNPNWSGISKITQGTNTKIWRVRNNYVQSVINVVGLVPKDLDEAFENPSDTSDDYLWASWKNGITPAPGISGITASSFSKPSDQFITPNINFSSTLNSADLISSEHTNIDTSRDLFVVCRGFIKISQRGYYNFFMNVGNTGNANDKSHIGLFSLKHKTTYSEDEVNQLNSIDDFTFTRSTGDITYSVTNGTETRTLYGRQSEYGVVELRQNEDVDDGYDVYGQDSAYYLLEKGYYAYEIKSTYNTLKNKKLTLSWQMWNEVTRPTGTYFEIIQHKSIIPTNALFTFNEFSQSIENTEGKGLMSIPHNLIEGGDAIKVVYFNSHESNNNVSGIISKNKTFKDLEIIARLSPVNVTSAESAINVKQPSKKFGIIFRAINNEKDLYANIDTYYAFIFDGRFGKYGIAQISYENEIEQVYYRYLNLNKNSTDLDKRIFHDYLTDEYDHIVELDENTFYEFKVDVQNNNVSVYYRESSEFTTAVNSIKKSIAIDLTKYNPNVDEWKTLIDSVSLDQDDPQTETFDIDENIIDVPQKYSVINTAGTYGLMVFDSIFKVNKISIKSHDEEDYNRVVTNDKWKTIKPKYLDTRSTKTLKYNSYEIDGPESPINSSFKIQIIENYDGSSRKVLPENLNTITDNAINRVFADGVSGTDFGSRLNILFDNDYINDRFENTADVLNAIRVPIGNFYEPNIEWSKLDNGFTSISHAKFSKLISDESRIMPHSIAYVNSEISYVSELSRNSSDDSYLILDTVLNEYIQATNDVIYNGIWEEIAPHSADETFNVPTLGTITNEAFEIINRNSKPIGVRIKTQEAFEKIQCRYCENAIVWGLYDITFPTNAVDTLQDFGINVTKFRYFIPIGKLDITNPKFLPPSGLLENLNIDIELLGVYSHMDLNNFIGNNTAKNIGFTIDKYNAFEAKYKSKVKCNYFIDLKVSFIDKLTKFNDTPVRKNIPKQCNPGSYLYRNPEDKRDENVCGDYVSNAYVLPEKLLKIVEYLETKYPVGKNNQIDEKFNTEFNWWMPEELWLRRDFTVLYPDNSDAKLFSGFSDINNSFYGQTITSSGLKISLDDGFDADVGEYVLDGEWCVSSVSWDSDYFTVPGISGDISEIKIGEKLSAPIPLETVNVSGQNYLTFGKYYNDETIGKRTFNPVGLFNWFQNHSVGISGSEMTGWEVSDWNQELVDCFSFKGIYGKINSNMFEINKYWGFFSEQIPPIGSRVNIKYSNRNCYEIDGENSPSATEYNVTLGTSDGYNGFYSVPPLIERYVDWITQVSSITIDNYTIESDEYYTSKNTENQNQDLIQLNLRTDKFDFNKFIGSTIYLDFFFDKLFELDSESTRIDDYGNNRKINWITYVDNNSYYKIATREIDTELKYTSGSLPYNITTYKNKNVYQAVNKFDETRIDTTSGTNENKKLDQNVVGLENNSGFKNIMSLIGIESNNYTISADFIFDKSINSSSFNRNFELILKAETNFVVETNDWGITDFYYVGVGTNNFDVGLGMRSLDLKTGEVKETFLASFGDYNLRNIHSDTWYTLKAEISDENIKVFFNETGNDDRLVLNYNINKKYEKLTERYLKGEFETLQSVIIGLDELGITYPSQLSNKVSSDYTFDNFKNEFAGTLPIDGQYCGFRVFNGLTYVTNVSYTAKTPKKYKFGSAFDGGGFNQLIYKILNRFTIKPSASIRKIDGSLNGYFFVLIDDMLFYQVDGNDPEKYINKVDDFKVVHDKIIVVEKIPPTDGAIGLNVWTPGTHEFTWSLVPGTNIYGITQYTQLLSKIPNATHISMTRTFSNGLTTTREIGYVSGMTGNITGNNSVLTPGDEIVVTIGGDREISFPLNGELARFNKFVRAYHEGFTKEYPILIKDKTFYEDGLERYIEMADKSIDEVYINDSRLHIVFEDN